MTTETLLRLVVHNHPAESLSAAEREALQRGVAKVVAFGAQVGVSIDQMIDYLESGLTVRELLEYLAACSGEAV
jgi:hypothetical protein